MVNSKDFFFYMLENSGNSKNMKKLRDYVDQA